MGRGGDEGEREQRDEWGQGLRDEDTRDPYGKNFGERQSRGEIMRWHLERMMRRSGGGQHGNRRG